MKKPRGTSTNDNLLHAMIRKTSIAITRSGSIDSQGRELVVASGYSKGGQFGYFIIREHLVGDQYIYSEQREFFKKVNERSFQEALTKLKEIVLNEAPANI